MKVLVSKKYHSTISIFTNGLKGEFKWLNEINKVLNHYEELIGSFRTRQELRAGLVK